MYKDEILQLRRSGKTYNEIVDNLGCSVATVSKHCRNAGLGGNPANSVTEEEKLKMQQLRDEGKTLKEISKILDRSVNCIVQYVKPKYSNKKGLTNTERVQRWRKRTKKRLVEYKGGECVICGYDKSIYALEFHHINPLDKKFHISNPNTRSLKMLKEEADKCILVCSNCHREIEYDVTVIPEDLMTQHCSVH